ncbi:hypothetical protein VP01_403g2, partial [Puccinia sorghi]
MMRFHKFITSFNGYFLDPERKGKAQQALCIFKQSCNVDSYTQQFNPLPWRIEGEHLTCNFPTAHACEIRQTQCTTATNPSAMDISAMNCCLSNSEGKKMMQACVELLLRGDSERNQTRTGEQGGLFWESDEREQGRENHLRETRRAW